MGCLSKVISLANSCYPSSSAAGPSCTSRAFQIFKKALPAFAGGVIGGAVGYALFGAGLAFFGTGPFGLGIFGLATAGAIVALALVLLVKGGQRCRRNYCARTSTNRESILLPITTIPDRLNAPRGLLDLNSSELEDLSPSPRQVSPVNSDSEDFHSDEPSDLDSTTDSIADLEADGIVKLEVNSDSENDN